MILSKFHHQNQLCSVMRNKLLFVFVYLYMDGAFPIFDQLCEKRLLKYWHASTSRRMTNIPEVSKTETSTGHVEGDVYFLYNLLMSAVNIQQWTN